MRNDVAGILFLLFTISCLPFQCQASRDLAIDLALDHVDISTGFVGTEVILYGAKPASENIAVILRGPSRSMVVRRKKNVGGIWINTQSMRFYNVPSYYDYAVSEPVAQMAEPALLRDYGIGLNALEFAPVYPETSSTISQFTEALIRNKQSDDLFPLQAGDVEFITDQFFKVRFTIPPQLPTGNYLVEAFLFDEGTIIARETKKLKVAQTGLNARLREFATQHGFLYGIFAILLALISGWTAHQIGKKTQIRHLQ